MPYLKPINSRVENDTFQAEHSSCRRFFVTDRKHRKSGVPKTELYSHIHAQQRFVRYQQIHHLKGISVARAFGLA